MPTLYDLVNGTSSNNTGSLNLPSQEDLVSSLPQQKAGLLAMKKQDKLHQLNGTITSVNTDADSGADWRLQGADAPEVFHENTQERNKVYQQYAMMNGTDLNTAKEVVDNEALPYKIARDNGYDLGQQIDEARRQGLIAPSFKPTSHEIYRLGDRASQFVNEDALANPTSGLLASKFTGNQDVYGRGLVSNDEFTNRAIAGGYMLPGSEDKTQYDNQVQLSNQARFSGQGLYDTDTNKKIMQSIKESSFIGKVHNPEPVYNTNGSDLVDAAQSGIGSMAASIGDAVVDSGVALARTIVQSTNDEAKVARTLNGDKSRIASEAMMKAIQGTPLESIISNETTGQVNFTGFDEAKKKEYYGYKESDELVNLQENLSKAYKSGDTLEMGKALVGAIAEPKAIAEILASSSGEIVAGATGIGTAALIVGKTNDILEARSKITGKPASEEDLLYASAGATVYGLINKLTGGMASIGTIKESTKVLTNNLTEVGLISTLEVIRDISKGAGKAYGIEGGEEVVQSLAESIGTKLGTEKASEILNEDAQAELFTSFGLGAAAGGVSHTAIDTPRKFYEQYKNNAPLSEINTIAENLSPEEKAKVSEVVTNTINTSENTINNTNTNINTINSTEDLIGLMVNATQVMNSIHQQIQSGITPDEATLNEYAKQGQILEAIDALTSKEANSTFVDSTVNAISTMAPNVATAIDNTTSISSPNRGLVDILNNTIIAMNLEPIENFSDLQTKYKDKLPEILNNLQKTGQAGQVFGALSGVLNLKTVNQAKSELVQKPEFKGKLVSLLTSSAKAIEKDTGIVRFKQKALAENVNSSRQTKSGLTDKFNAQTIIDSGVLTKLNGISQVTKQLQEYDTATLKELQSTLVNHQGAKGLNKLNTAIRDILHTRNQATKAESRILGTNEPIETDADYTTDSNGVTTPTGATSTQSTKTEDTTTSKPEDMTTSQEVLDEVTQEGKQVKNATTEEVKQRLTIMTELNCGGK